MSTSVPRTVLVVGATGTVGGEVTRRLAKRGATVRVLVRSPQRADLLPREVERVVGDLTDAAAVAGGLAGVDVAFYVSPHTADEERLARDFVARCAAASVRVVLLGAHVGGPNRWVRAIKRMVTGLMFRHYRPKFRLSERALRSGAVVLAPSNFYQNDELFLAQILDGEFVQPYKRVNRVDVRDIADVAVRALLEPQFPPGGHQIFGPASLRGEECAAVWARALGREVRYTGDDPARVRRAVAATLTGRKRADILASFRLLSRMQVPTTARDVEMTTRLLGRAPHTYEQYVASTVAEIARPRA